jgi:hypothetical protein
MGRPPSKFITNPKNARDPRRKRSDYFTRSELVQLMQSWRHENPGAGVEAFYRWYAYFGLPQDQIGQAELARVRQLVRDAKVRARKAGWFKE